MFWNASGLLSALSYHVTVLSTRLARIYSIYPVSYKLYAYTYTLPLEYTKRLCFTVAALLMKKVVLNFHPQSVQLCCYFLYTSTIIIP